MTDLILWCVFFTFLCNVLSVYIFVMLADKKNGYMGMFGPRDIVLMVVCTVGPIPTLVVWGSVLINGVDPVVDWFAHYLEY